MGELKNRERMNITLSKDTAAALRAHVAECGYNMSAIIEGLVREYLKTADHAAFAVFVDTIELKKRGRSWSEADLCDAYMEETDTNEKMIAVFDTKEAALEKLATVRTSSRILSSPIGDLVQAEIAFARKVIIDDEGELVEGLDVIEMKAEPVQPAEPDRFRVKGDDEDFLEAFYGWVDPDEAPSFETSELRDLWRGWSVEEPFEDWLEKHFEKA